MTFPAMNRGATFRAAPDAVCCEFDDGLAILDLGSNVYYSLNEVGAFVWNFIQTPRDAAEIRNQVTAEFDVDADRCASDIEALLASMTSHGLVVSHAQDAA